MPETSWQQHAQQKLSSALWNGVVKKNVLILTTSSWREPKRFRHQLADTLASEYNVIYVTLPYGLKKPKVTTVAQSGNITVVDISGPNFPLKIIFSIGIIKTFYQYFIGRKVGSLIKRYGSISTVFCFTCDYHYLLLELGNSRKIYVANDNHAAIASKESERNRVRKSEDKTINFCDEIIAVSAGILYALSGTGKPSHLIYPGHSSKVVSFKERSNKKKLIRTACFFGYIDWRLDFDAIESLLNEGWTVDLIGPVIGRSTELCKLMAKYERRLNLCAEIDSEDAGNVLAKYQILLMPYRFKSREQRDAIELPNKTFIYISALRPIVATYMPNLRFVRPGIIYMAKEDENISLLCDRAVVEDCIGYMIAREKLSVGNRWDSKLDQLRNIIENDI